MFISVVFYRLFGVLVMVMVMVEDVVGHRGVHDDDDDDDDVRCQQDSFW